MTPEQQRLLRPLNPHQTACDELLKATSVCLLCWPLSILHEAAMAHCTTVAERLSPVHIQTAYPHG